MTRPSRKVGLVPALALIFASGASLAQMIGQDVRINTYTTGGQIHIGVAPISDVGYVVVWHGLTETGSTEVSARRVTLTGQPAGADFRVNTYTSSEEQDPSVASDLAGNFVVVWQSQLQYGILGRRYDLLGAPLGDEFRVSVGGSYPAVARKPDGDFLVVWTAADEDGLGIYARRFLSSGAPAG
ncbi:MAG TPA: hypothetical protein VKF32_14790, partial [Thermoanaerobaculia bacterium]|nr:hypothetical protein [Thermoanaerobaculia bacterium]